jgi:hypothetical protein
VPGNPLKATRVIRYLLNYSGALGGQTEFPPTEFLIAYSLNIALDYHKSNITSALPDVLFLPAVDPNEFDFKLENRDDFYLLYAGKYRAFIGTPPYLPNRKIVEVLRHGSRAQTRVELIDLLSRCRAVISLENSSIITEAILSGAPGIFLPNQFLSEALAEHELGWDGTGWGIDEAEESRARLTLREGRDAYFKQIANFPQNLTLIFNKANDFFKDNTGNHYLTIPQNYSFLSAHRFRMSLQIISVLGFRTWLKVVKNFLLRRLSGRF